MPGACCSETASHNRPYVHERRLSLCNEAGSQHKGGADQLGNQRAERQQPWNVHSVEIGLQAFMRIACLKQSKT